MSPRRGGLHGAGRACVACACVLGCATTSTGATDADVARGRQASETGAAIVTTECARCHGRRGQGIADAPAILGPRALPEYARESPPSGIPGVQDPQMAEIEQRTEPAGAKMRLPFRTALDVYNFVSQHNRGPRIRSPQAKAAHDWAAVTFLLAAVGADLPAGGLTADNAGSVPLPHR
ncbi:MAG: cytochrome c [Polyangiaceae bacterium]|nr:cytochrome c [Polyangiaceae bacterium]